MFCGLPNTEIVVVVSVLVVEVVAVKVVVVKVVVVIVVVVAVTVVLLVVVVVEIVIIVVETWASFGGGHGRYVPHFWQWGVGGTRLSEVPPPTHTHVLGWKKNKVGLFQYLFVFYGHFYCTYPDYMFSLSTHIQIF